MFRSSCGVLRCYKMQIYSHSARFAQWKVCTPIRDQERDAVIYGLYGRLVLRSVVCRIVLLSFVCGAVWGFPVVIN